MLGVTVGSGPAFSVARLPSAAGSTNATVVKATPGKVFRISGVSTALAVKYLKLYNKASAPTVGTDIPAMTIALPITAPFAHELTHYGLLFPAGIAYAFTTNAADSDVMGIGAGDVLGFNMLYL